MLYLLHQNDLDMNDTEGSRDFGELFSVIQSDSNDSGCADSFVSCDTGKIRSRKLKTYIKTTVLDSCPYYGKYKRIR